MKGHNCTFNSSNFRFMFMYLAIYLCTDGSLLSLCTANPHNYFLLLIIPPNWAKWEQQTGAASGSPWAGPGWAAASACRWCCGASRSPAGPGPSEPGGVAPTGRTCCSGGTPRPYPAPRRLHPGQAGLQGSPGMQPPREKRGGFRIEVQKTVANHILFSVFGTSWCKLKSIKRT